MHMLNNNTVVLNGNRDIIEASLSNVVEFSPGSDLDLVRDKANPYLLRDVDLVWTVDLVGVLADPDKTEVVGNLIKYGDLDLEPLDHYIGADTKNWCASDNLVGNKIQRYCF